MLVSSAFARKSIADACLKSRSVFHGRARFFSIRDVLHLLTGKMNE
jgi:hypothetical protein